MKYILLGILIIGSTTAQTLRPGKCPTINNITNFDLKKVVGTWYNAAYYKGGYTVNGLCSTNEYASYKNGSLYYNFTTTDPSTGEKVGLTGPVWQLESGKNYLLAAYPAIASASSLYWMFTDYTSYFAEWSCIDINSEGKQLSAGYIWTKDPKAVESSLEKAYEILEQNGVSRDLFTKANPGNC